MTGSWVLARYAHRFGPHAYSRCSRSKQGGYQCGELRASVNSMTKIGAQGMNEMITSWKKSNFHRRLLHDLFPDKFTDQDGMLILAILHSCEIHLSSSVLKGHPDLTSIEPITTRHAARVIASLWRGSNDPRSDYFYWYRLWNGEWKGYAHLERISAEDAERCRELKYCLEKHPVVEEIVPCEWNPFVPDV